MLLEQATFWWSASELSPCSGVAGWIGCNDTHVTGELNWQIHFRDFSNDGVNNSLHWVEHPSATGTLYLMERVALHEGLHNVLDIGDHDSQSWVYTIMQAQSPAQGVNGWDTD